MSANIKFVASNSNCAFLNGFVESSVETPADGLNGECIVHYSGQYRNCTMTVKLVNGVREGIAVIVNGSVPYLRLEYKQGSLTGVVAKMNSSGSVELRGHLVDGVEDGLFEEFDSNNKAVWRGYYRNGKRNGKGEELKDYGTGRSGGLSSSSGYRRYESKSVVTPKEVRTVVVPSSLTYAPLTIEVLEIRNDCYNDSSVTEFKLSGLVRLKRITMGDDCFGSVRSFELDGLSELESIEIGQRSFRINDKERMDGTCRIVNCPKLKSIQIGNVSFSDYHSFELSNLPSLQSIEIGWKCFYYTPSFSLTGLVD